MFTPKRTGVQLNLKHEMLIDLDEYMERLKEVANEEREYSACLEQEKNKWKWIAYHRIEAEYGNTKRKVVERRADEVATLGDEYERLPRP
jgi:hypothetical protein